MITFKSGVQGFFALALAALPACTAQADPILSVDFAKPGGSPLVKDKFGVYQTPLVTMERLVASLPLLREAGIQDFRYELGWGKPDALASSQISGSPEHPTPDLTALDPLAERLRALGVRPLWVLGYCPDPLKPTLGWPAWKELPSDLTQWRALCQAYAAHWRGPAGTPAPAYEVWNEPDLPEGSGGKVFFNGSASGYSRLYAATVAGVHAGDPDALVGGPAVAYDLSYLTPLLAQTMSFASIHAYANFPGQLAGLRRALAGRSGLPIYLSEYASFLPAEMSPNGPQSRFPAAMRFFRDVAGLLEEPGLSKVYWAQWLDAGQAPGMGLITWDGHCKALFQAFKIYAELPTTRVSVQQAESVPGVRLLAAVAARGAGVVLWNESEADHAVRVNLAGLPFRGGRMETYRIDANHGSFVDDPAAEELRVTETMELARDGSGTWAGTIPASGVVYLKMLASE